MSKTPDYLTVQGAARSLSCTVTYIFRLLWNNRFPNAFKRNKRWFIPPGDVEAYRAAAADWKRR